MANKILLVGQTPPPYGGQAISIQRLLDYDFADIQLNHLPLGASSSMAEIGKFNFRKVLHTFKIIGQIYYQRIFRGIRVLYYPPAIFNRNALLRDLLILISTRWLFEKTIFHFHAANFKLSYQALPKLIAKIFLKAFSAPDVAICISKYSLQEIEFIKPKRTFFVPNGLPDMFQNYSQYKNNQKCLVLFAGALYESKGVYDLLEAGRLLKETGVSFQLELMGEGPRTIITALSDFIRKHEMQKDVKLLGRLNSEEKWKAYAKADLLCLPTHLDNLPNVIIEAMMFELPVVSTPVGGIPDLIEEGVNGFLVPIKDPVQLADRLRRLILDKELRLKMGKAGREKYLKEFTLERERDNLYQALKAAFE